VQITGTNVDAQSTTGRQIREFERERRKQKVPAEKASAAIIHAY
jgi:hypothetical protein